MFERITPFARFAISGVIAFFIDAGLVQLLVTALNCNPFAARIVSFGAAVSFTWRFNRRFTFTPPPGLTWWREGLTYFGTQFGGFTVNYAVYSLVLWGFAIAWTVPALGVAAGSLAGLSVNYLAARRLVYRGRLRP